MTNRRPNFLLISTDQQRADHLGCYGARVLKTPHIDGLAANGTRCERAYVASPVCMPNRASLITGRMPSVHGLRHNGLNLSPSSVTVADSMRVSGWSTALVGKAHFQCVTTRPPLLTGDASNVHTIPIPEARYEEVAIFEQELCDRWRDDPEHDLVYPYYGFETVDLAVEHGDQVEGHYSRWLAQRHAEPAKIRGPEHALPGSVRKAPQAWRTAMPEALYPTRYIEEQTIRRLTGFASEPSKPFLLWASFCDPHHPFTPPGRYWDMYDPDEVELPSSFTASGRTGYSEILRQQREDGAARLTGSAAIAVDESELRAAIALTYGAITMIDDAVGAILTALDELGLSENTIVVFFSDHGDLMGEHGLIFKGPLHYQALVRIPLIWSDGRYPQGRVHTDPISSIDVPATILSTAGIAPFNGMQGRPFVSEGGDLVTARRCVLIEDEVQSNLPGHDVRGRARTLIANQWRLTIYDGVKQGVLHNLHEDPAETINLWDDPKSSAVRAEMTESLVRQMIAHSETSPLPHYAA